VIDGARCGLVLRLQPEAPMWRISVGKPAHGGGQGGEAEGRFTTRRLLLPISLRIVDQIQQLSSRNYVNALKLSKSA
jgi:hypothetical protein